MKLNQFYLILITTLVASLLASCGGGGGGGGGSGSGNTNNSNDPLPDIEPSTPIDSSVWSEASPESVGMDSTIISAAFDEAFVDGTYTQAALVIKDSKLVYERYRGIEANEKTTLVSSYSDTWDNGFDSETVQAQFGTRDKDSLATSWSTAKSFTSVLIAIAIEQGYIESLDQSAADFINEWGGDQRADITIRNLLDMRSGLHMICRNSPTSQLDECNGTERADGDLLFFDNQLEPCINRQLATTGVYQPWYWGATFEEGDWLYSNCDSMVLGEILFRATGQSLENYADINLFSKIGMEASWWQDNDPTGQVDGNYLSYCCIDATPRDFAKFGQLLLNNGVWDGEQIIPQSYIDNIKSIAIDSTAYGEVSYGLQFWTVGPQIQADGSTFPLANTVYSTIGYDGQYIMIDFDNNMLVLRNSLYQPVLNRSNDRKYKTTNEAATSNFVSTLPSFTVVGTSTTFNNTNLLYQVTQSITSQ